MTRSKYVYKKELNLGKSTLSILVIILLLGLLGGGLLVSSYPPTNPSSPNPSPPGQTLGGKALQMLGYHPPTPTPTLPPPTPTPTYTPGTPLPTATPPNPGGGGSLLCGTNLGLFNDNDWVSNSAAQASLATLHVHTIRIPWRAGKEDPTGSRLVKSVQIAHSLGVVPLIVLPSETTYLSQDIQMIKQLNSVMNGSQIFYELGNEVFDSAYMGKWDQIIPQLKPVAVNAWFGGPVAMLNAGTNATTNMANFYVHANPTPDFLDWHEYTCGHTDSAQYCYDHVANAPGHNWGQHMLDTLKALSAFGVPTMPKVFITEWNYDSAALGANTPDPRLATLNSMHFVNAALTELKKNGVYAAYHYVLNTNGDYNLINYNGTLTGEGQDFQSTCASL